MTIYQIRIVIWGSSAHLGIAAIDLQLLPIQIQNQFVTTFSIIAGVALRFSEIMPTKQLGILPKIASRMC